MTRRYPRLFILIAILFSAASGHGAPQLGDYAEDATLHFIWTTNGADGAAITRATDGTVAVYKDNGVTQSVAGVTDTEDFDGVTGIHACTIDLSADAFYATGANYTVVVSAATIDGMTVNAALAHFSIQNRYTRGTDSAALAATALSTATWTGARAGYLDELAAANLPADLDAALADTNEIQAALADGGFTDLIIDAILADVTGINGDVMRGTDSAATAAVWTAARAGALTDWLDGGRLDLILDAVGAGGDATSANQTTIIAHLTGIKGSTWTTQDLEALYTAAVAIQARTDLITAGSITTVSAVAADNAVTVIAGDDYETDDGTELSWTTTGYAGPSLTAATVQFRLITRANYDRGDGTAALAVTGAIAIDGTTITYTADLTAAQTGALNTRPPGQPLNYKYMLRVTLANGRILTPVIGDCTVTADID